MARTCSSGGGKNKSHSDADAKQRDKTIFDPRIQPTEPAIFCSSMYYLAADTHTEDDNAARENVLGLSKEDFYQCLEENFDLYFCCWKDNSAPALQAKQ